MTNANGLIAIHLTRSRYLDHLVSGMLPIRCMSVGSLETPATELTMFTSMVCSLNVHSILSGLALFPLYHPGLLT